MYYSSFSKFQINFKYCLLMWKLKIICTTQIKWILFSSSLNETEVLANYLPTPQIGTAPACRIENIIKIKLKRRFADEKALRLPKNETFPVVLVHGCKKWTNFKKARIPSFTLLGLVLTKCVQNSRRRNSVWAGKVLPLSEQSFWEFLLKFRLRFFKSFDSSFWTKKTKWWNNFSSCN